MTPLNNSDKLDDLFRDNLKNFRQEPPKKSWGKIREQMNATNRAPWTTYAEGFALLCIVGIVLFSLYRYAPEGTKQKVKNAKELVYGGKKKEAGKPKTEVHPAQPVVRNVQNTQSHLNNAEIERNRKTDSGQESGIAQVTSPEHNRITKSQQPTASNQQSAANSQQPTASSQSPVTSRRPHSKKQQTQTTGTAQVSGKLPHPAKNNPPHADIVVMTPKTEQSFTSSAEPMAFLELKTILVRESNPGLKEIAPVTDEALNIPSKILFKERNNGNSEFHFGITYTLNNTWILNQNTYGEFSGAELNYKVDFGSAYGFLAGYDYKGKYGIQLECNLNSLQGQKYEDNLRIGHIKREVNLHYSSFPLLFKLKTDLSNKENLKMKFNYLIGVQYDILRSATITTNDKTTNVMERFRKHDVSAILGLEANIYVFDNFYFNLGIRGSISSNINDDDYFVPAETSGIFKHYNKSHNILGGINAGFNYSFGK